MLHGMNGRPAPVVPFAARLVGATFGFAFAGIGLTVLGFLWFGDDGFGGPPVFFKLFGSFIAIVFVVMGGAMGFAALSAQAKVLAGKSAAAPPSPPSPAIPSRSSGPYTCPDCGAALTSSTEASPHGDIKCTHCGAWFNIHRRTP